MATTTALDIINSALRVLQVSAPDVTLSANDANDALDALNLMLAGWSNESLMVHHVIKEAFPLVIGHNPYTIGAGGDFNTDVPIEIMGATVTINGADYRVVQMAYDDWSAIRLKTLQTGYTEYLYLDRKWPLADLYIYPVSNLTSTLTLYSRKALAQFSSLTANFDLPPGYARAMKYGLAIELAPEYQTSAGADVLALFTSAKAQLKRTNKRPITLNVDPMLTNGPDKRYNIYRGD